MTTDTTATAILTPQSINFPIPEENACRSKQISEPNNSKLPSSLSQYKIHQQLSVGKDGIAYEATDRRTGAKVELWKLNSSTQVEGRLKEIERRLNLAQLLDHTSAQQVFGTFVDDNSQIVIVEPAYEHRLSEWQLLGGANCNPLKILREVTQALVAAHRLGLTHEALTPISIRLRKDLAPQLDFTHLDIGSADKSAGYDVSVSSPNAFENHDPANDSLCIGKLIQWLFDEHPEVEQACRDRSGRHAAEIKQLAQSSIHDPPTERPALSKYLDCFDWFLDAANNEKQSEESPTVSRTAGSTSETTNEPDGFAVDLSSTAELTPKITDNSSKTQLPSQPILADSTAEIALPADESGATEDRGLLGPVPTRKQTAHRMLTTDDCLGRYRILKKIGEGGMGAVFKAEDISDGKFVAIKVLSQSATLRANALQRFQKEARLLAAVNNPNIANLIEVNEQDGLHYIVLEFVEGVDLSQILTKHAPLSETQALAVAADVARALVDAHQSEIVHRDIKPENILLKLSADFSVEDLIETSSMPTAKLTDFGIARHVDQSESLAVTQAGGILGTPMYMSPEQCKGKGEVSPQSDVYSLGITLYEMLCGRPPFQADDPMKLAGMHCFEAPVALQKINPQVSEVAAAIVSKAMSKSPGDRYADAAHILRELDQALRGEPSDIAVHPLLPDHDPQQIVANEMIWNCQSTSEQLWPLVANTERLNRAMGLPAVKYTTRVGDDGKARRFGDISLAGFHITWEEHPFEWIEGRRMSVLREFEGGPFQWFMSTVELKRQPQGGTLLKHQVKILPSNIMGRVLAKVETGSKCRRSLDRVYTRIDETLTGKNGDSPLVDPFEPAKPLSRHQRQRLESRIDQLIRQGVDTELAQLLADFVAVSPAQELAKIRPLQLAERLQVDSQQLIDACLLACNEGILNLQWDILCPTCRVAADTQTTLKQLQAHTHCEACNTDFDSDAANSVEMVFRVNSDLRETEIGKYCIGGPGHSPHVVAQVRIEPEERIELELNLPIGDYVLRGPQLAKSLTLKVQTEGAPSQIDITLNSKLDNRHSPTLRAGKQLLWITNKFEALQVVRLERTIPRNDVITAAQASTFPRFRELFPGEVLDSGQLISTEQVTMLVTTIPDVDSIYVSMGDAAAYDLVKRHLEFQQSTIQASNGAVIKSVGEGLVAVFEKTEEAVNCAFDLAIAESLDAELKRLEISIGVHRGPALVTTVNGRLDYFGATARIASSLPSTSTGISLTEPVFADPAVHQSLSKRNEPNNLRTINLPGKPNQLVQTFTVNRNA